MPAAPAASAPAAAKDLSNIQWLDDAVIRKARLTAGPAPAFPPEPKFELALDVQPEPMPLRWAGGWMLAKVTINGADAGWFKIATGWCFSGIDPQVVLLPEQIAEGKRRADQFKPQGRTQP